jgi:hypothetical protein
MTNMSSGGDGTLTPSSVVSLGSGGMPSRMNGGMNGGMNGKPLF